MKVQAWSPNLTAERAAEAGVTFVPSKADFFRTSDVISIHMVQVPSTIDLVTYKDLSLMKPTAHLVNTSRGPIVNEKDLLRILEEEKIGGAALDVFDVEPMAVDHPLRKAKNVTLTPHTGYVSDDVYKVCYTPLLECRWRDSEHWVSGLVACDHGERCCVLECETGERDERSRILCLQSCEVGRQVLNGPHMHESSDPARSTTLYL